MRRKAIRGAGYAIAVLIILLAVAYVGRRPGHVPLYDADLVRLAETTRQGYCSGVTFWKTQGEGSAESAAACRKEHREESGRVDLLGAEKGFCRGIVDSGWAEGTPSDCVAILGSYQYWPTYDGSLSSAWNRARPYPRPALPSDGHGDDGSRTGTRPDVPGR